MKHLLSKKIPLILTTLFCVQGMSEQLQTVYRSYSSSDFLFSLSPTEGPKADYMTDEARFALSTTNTAGTRALYRCRITATLSSHFLSVSPNCEGQTVEGVLGYMSTVQKNNLVPLSRYVNLTNNAHVVTVPGDEVNFKNWKFEGVLGYVQPIAIPKVVQTPDDGKKYFSYFAGAMDGVGTGNYIPELAKVSNLIFIKSPTNLEQKLVECEKLGLKAVVTFDWLFFDQNFRLKENYAELFKAVEPIVRRHLSTIVAFYGQDEAYNNGLFRKTKVGEIYYGQETMGRFLKSKFPNTPIGVIFTTYEIADNRPLFPSFDWFGFDCYTENMQCGYQGQTHSVEWFYDRLNSMMNALTVKDGKKRYLISVPQAGHPVSDGPVVGERSIKTQVPQYRQIIKKYPNLKVVMPFIWQTFNDGASNWIGAREMPEVVKMYKSFYEDFMAGKL